MNKEKYSKFITAWANFLNKDTQAVIQDILTKVHNIHKSGIKVYPESTKLFRAFEECSYDNLKVVILAQDPYHDGSAIGKCFDNIYLTTTKTDSMITTYFPKWAPSLKNIDKELESEGFSLINRLVKSIETKDEVSVLEHLPPQGVLLLNTALTVEAGKPESHLDLWEPFTKKVIEEINKKDDIIWLLWGAKALRYKDLILNPTHKFVITSHPSPLGATKPMKGYPAFIGSKPFSKVNEYLKEMNKTLIQW